MNDDDLDEFIAALQDVVLPVGVPVLPGLDLAAHFSVPGDPGESTGAWFDVVVLRSGRVALAMGQVPGSGLASVAAAGGVSAVIRAGMLCHEDVVAALQLAALHAEHSADVMGTSVVLAMLDLRTGDLTYATAGHEAPVLAGGGTTRQLARLGGGTLGSGAEIVAGRQRVEVGDLVVLGSGPLSVSHLVEATRVTGDASATCEALASAVVDGQVRGAVTVLTAEVREVTTRDLELDLELDETTTRRARRELESWLSTLGATPMESLSLTHAAAELVANSVEHSRGADGVVGTSVTVRGSHAADGAVVVEVADRGLWREATDDIARGRGLAMAAGLVDGLDVTSDAEGTRARLRHRLSRPVLVDRVPVRTDWTVPEPLAVTETTLGTVRLSGEFGHDDVDEISYALLVASRGRTRDVDIDLSDVTSISAGGLRVLADLVHEQSGHVGSRVDRAVVVLHARTGSASQVELERAGITHHAS